MAEFEYETITDGDKLMLARNFLRGRESDHYQLSLSDEPAQRSRLDSMEKEILATREEVQRLEQEIASAPAPTRELEGPPMPADQRPGGDAGDIARVSQPQGEDRPPRSSRAKAASRQTEEK